MTINVTDDVPQLGSPQTNRVAENSRVWAFLAYLLPVIGWILVLLFARKDRFANYHMRQSIALVLTLILAPLVWLLFAYISALLIPWVGTLVSASTFSLVIAVGVVFIVDWIWGMLNAIRGIERPLPVPGSIGSRMAG